VSDEATSVVFVSGADAFYPEGAEGPKYVPGDVVSLTPEQRVVAGEQGLVFGPVPDVTAVTTEAMASGPPSISEPPVLASVDASQAAMDAKTAASVATAPPTPTNPSGEPPVSTELTPPPPV